MVDRCTADSDAGAPTVAGVPADGVQVEPVGVVAGAADEPVNSPAAGA